MRALPQLPSPNSTAVVETRTLELGPVQGRPVPDAPPPVQRSRAQSLLLVLSTSLAGVFCFLYLTKPVVVKASAVASPPAALPPAPSAPVVKETPLSVTETSSILPDSKALPGEISRPQPSDPRGLGTTNASAFEETNLRIQHVLGAQGPAGEDLGRIILDVPVLYRSRALRWTPQEIARARQLMAGIANYQEKSRALRAEGSQLLSAWNELIGSSIPGDSLRADSPSLPANQDTGRGAGGNLDTIHSIEMR